MGTSAVGLAHVNIEMDFNNKFWDIEAICDNTRLDPNIYSSPPNKLIVLRTFAKLKRICKKS